jgi:hypothetical protein
MTLRMHAKIKTEKSFHAMMRICNGAISRMFAEQIDSMGHDDPDNFKSMSQRMDLGTIKTKMLSDPYLCVSEWKSSLHANWTHTIEPWKRYLVRLRLIVTPNSDYLEAKSASATELIELNLSR